MKAIITIAIVYCFIYGWHMLRAGKEHREANRVTDPFAKWSNKR